MTVDLVMELSGGKYQAASGITATVGLDEKTQNLKDRQEIAQAFDIFHQRIQTITSEDQKKLERNQIQGRLIGASEMACTEFQRSLNNVQSGSNFTLGSISTVLAGAGAIVTKVDMARLLSGSSAIVSGIRSEFNSDYFFKQTAAVLTKAIDSWRKETKEALRQAQQRKYADYTVEDAIADAIAYNDGCSLVFGLQRISDAVTVEEDPGLQRLAKLLNSRGNVKATNEGLVLTVNNISALQEEVATQIKGISPPDYELDAAKLHISQSSAELIRKIEEMKNVDVSLTSSLEQRVNIQKTATETALKNLTDKSHTLTNGYFYAVKQVTSARKDETAFMSARADFYEQLAKIGSFRQEIDLPSQAFDSELKTIRKELEKLTPPPPTVTNASSQSTNTTTSDTAISAK